MKRNPQSGFTLIEALIVISIIALIVGIGTPSLLSALPGLRVSGAAREVLSDMRLARSRAVESGVPMGLEFDSPGTTHYFLFRDVNGDEAYVATDDEIVKQVTLIDTYKAIALKSNDGGVPADGVDLDNAGSNTIVFRSNGSASGSGAVYFMPANDPATFHDRNRRVRVVSPTGNGRIESYDGTTWQ